MNSALSIFASSFLAISIASATAHAATASVSLSVSVTVQASCAASAPSMRLGTYVEAQVNPASAVSVQCSHPTPYKVSLSAGPPGAPVENGKMIGPAQLRYLLRSGSRGVVNWGQMAGVDTAPITSNGSVQTLSVPGQIPAGRHVEGGTYADTIAVTVTY